MSRQWGSPYHGGIGMINFPLISDEDKELSRSYRVLFNNSVPLRGLFIIDKKGIIRHSQINDLPLGKNIDEVLRIVDAVEHIDTYGEVCPANWQQGSNSQAINQQEALSTLN
ncbi:MAG: redoxin domain-containing protein [Chlamydiota bacterium]